MASNIDESTKTCAWIHRIFNHLNQMESMITHNWPTIDRSELLAFVQNPIDLENIKFVEKTVNGGTALIHFGKYCNALPVAIKAAHPGDNLDLSREVAKHYILRQLVVGTNIHIPKIIGVNSEMLVIERVRGKVLESLSKQDFSSIVKFCQFLFILGYQHGDLHCGNVIKREDGELFIIDYGQDSRESGSTDDITSLKILFRLVKDCSTDFPNTVNALFAEMETQIREARVNDSVFPARQKFFVKLLRLLDGENMTYLAFIMSGGNGAPVRYISKDDGEFFTFLDGLEATNARIIAVDASPICVAGAWFFLDERYHTSRFLEVPTNKQKLIQLSQSERIFARGQRFKRQ
jgi:tRNA A-37 threonylcarbamoyl transferase component Bud32